jgi:hypothetical protein
LQRILSDNEFSALMKLHIQDIIELLINRGEFFSILTNITNITFEPPLPDHIKVNFKPITLFVIAEYTFESCSIDDDFLYFEAGFGKENIGSFITIPLGSIVQIIIGETPIFINLSLEQNKKDKYKDKGVQKSTNIFLSNPKNKKILKK